MIYFVIFIAILAGYPLLHAGLIPTHDGEYHVIRFYEFFKSLSNGMLFPRWANDLNNGYGVPLFSYVYPLPNYLASFLHVFQISFIDAFKLQMFFALIFGGVFMYLWSKKFWGIYGGVISSVAYTYAPYHFVDIYVRGSIGEVWALAFLPLLLWSIDMYFVNKKRIYILLISISTSLIIFSHNILALLFIPFSIFYVLIITAKEKKLIAVKKVFYSVFLGIGIASIFWLPAIAEKNLVKGLQIYDIKENFPDLSQLLIPSWGTGFSKDDLANQMSFQIGIANLISILIGIVLLIKTRHTKESILYGSLLLITCILIFLMLPISLSIWQMIPLMSYFQFPWRLLSLVILLTAFMAGGLAKLTSLKVIYCIFILSIILLTIAYTKPAYYMYRDDEYYIKRSNFINGTNSPGDLFNTIWFNGKPKSSSSLFQKDAKFSLEKNNSNYYKGNLYVSDDVILQINKTYFPSWKFFIDNRQQEIKPSAEGLIKAKITKGSHQFVLLQGLTIWQKTGSIISVISILIVSFYCKYAKTKEN